MAEDAYQALPPGPRAAARRVLLRLCDAGDDGALDLRRRLPIDEAAPDHDADARAALATLVDRRLLTVDRDTVEVAHEALLREWPRLRTWLDEDVQGRRLHRRLGDAARSWEANDHDPSELYRGTRLDGAVDWAAGHDADLNDAERSLPRRQPGRGRARRGRRPPAHRRQGQDQPAPGRAAGRASASCWSWRSSPASSSCASGTGPRTTARAAQARQLASESVLALDEDPERGMLLALEAVDAAALAGERPLPEAVGALHQAVQTSADRLPRRRRRPGRRRQRDGPMLATARRATISEATVIWDAATGRQLRTLTDPGRRSTDVALQPGRAAGGDLLDRPMTTAAAGGHRLGCRDRREVSAFPARPGTYVDADVQPRRPLRSPPLVTGDGAGWTVWDVASATELRLRSEPGRASGSLDVRPGRRGRSSSPSRAPNGSDSTRPTTASESAALATPGLRARALWRSTRAGQRLALGSQASSAVAGVGPGDPAAGPVDSRGRRRTGRLEPRRRPPRHRRLEPGGRSASSTPPRARRS